MIHVGRIASTEGVLLRSVRLEAIADNPGVYATTLAQAEGQSADQWHRMAEGGSVGADQGTWFARDDPADPAADASPPVGPPVGMVSAYRTADDVVTVTSLWAAPSHRGVGVADVLLEHVTRWAVASGGTELRLWVLERNELVRRFYEALGFEPTGEEMRYEPDPELIEREMRKPLA